MRLLGSGAPTEGSKKVVAAPVLAGSAAAWPMGTADVPPGPESGPALQPASSASAQSRTSARRDGRRRGRGRRDGRALAGTPAMSANPLLILRRSTTTTFPRHLHAR